MAISNFNAWCSMMKNTSLRICVIILLLNIGTVQGSTDIYLLLVQTQLRYIYFVLSYHHSPTNTCSRDLAIIITPFSAQTVNVVSRAIGTCPCSCFKSSVPSNQDLTSSESKILSLSIIDAQLLANT